MEPFQPLTDEQWLALEPLFPKPEKRGRGKPHIPWRTVINSILYVLCTKEKWSALPKTPDFATKSSAHRWYLFWKRTGRLDEILSPLRSFNPKRELVLPPQRATYTRALYEQRAIQTSASL